MKTSTLAVLSTVALVAALLAGCSTPETRISANPAAFARLAPPQQALVKAGRVGIGFDMDAVKLALGEPDRVTLRNDSSGRTQIWHYVEVEYADPFPQFMYVPAYYMSPGPYAGHRPWRGGYRGGWRGGAGWMPSPTYYPIFADLRVESVRDRVRVEFKDGKVVAFNEELPPY
jgi:hypothetical protein